MREKTENNFEGKRTKKSRHSQSFERGVEESDHEGLKFKMILRFGEEKEISSMSSVKTIL